MGQRRRLTRSGLRQRLMQNHGGRGEPRRWVAEAVGVEVWRLNKGVAGSSHRCGYGRAGSTAEASPWQRGRDDTTGLSRGNLEVGRMASEAEAEKAHPARSQGLLRAGSSTTVSGPMWAGGS